MNKLFPEYFVSGNGQTLWSRVYYQRPDFRPYQPSWVDTNKLGHTKDILTSYLLEKHCGI